MDRNTANYITGELYDACGSLSESMDIIEQLEGVLKEEGLDDYAEDIFYCSQAMRKAYRGLVYVKKEIGQ